jgi:hypothetical protein
MLAADHEGAVEGGIMGIMTPLAWVWLDRRREAPDRREGFVALRAKADAASPRRHRRVRRL